MWKVKIHKKAQKAVKRHPLVIKSFNSLLNDLAQYGPQLTWWSHFGKLRNGSGLFHCHLNNNSPVMIALWMVINEEKRELEVKDVQTHQEFDSKN